ncbi:MAG: translation elongation factor Ts [Deltaproteobacteria bacterium]|nr:translation elongation factor Ts [Deltaproteobacteria bacterium]
MAEITGKMVKELRDRTQAGMVDCKKALQECDGDMEKAILFLRKKGLARAAKKAGREASEGVIGSYIHGEGRIGVLIEMNCETDFLARTEEFQKLVREVAMQIAASSPLYVKREEVPADFIEKEKEVRAAALKEQGKPDTIIPKIVDGQIKKWYGEICLMEQTYNRNRDLTIEELIKALSGTTGENIQVRRFTRYEMGAGE